MAHYSKSQIFVQKFNLDKTLTFHEFFTQIFFLKIFLTFNVKFLAFGVLKEYGDF